MIIKQSITLIIARGLSYLSTLIILPSFITITDPNEYSNIVLLATLIGLAPLFDGGQAVAISRRIAQIARLNIEQDIQQQTLSSKAIRESFLWSVLISTGLVTTWSALSGTSHLTPQIAIMSVATTAIATLSNTCCRLLLVDIFSKRIAATLILGPLTTALLLAHLRYSNNSDLRLVALTFTFGGLIPAAHYISSKIAPGNHFLSWKFQRQENSDSEDNYRSLSKSIFLSQIISIAVVAKNPLIIKILCDHSTLGQYSVFWAIHSLLIAPTASMQAPLLTKYSKMHGGNKHSVRDYIKPIIKHTAAGIGFAGSISIATFFLADLVKGDFTEIFSILTGFNMAVIFLCACVYITSIILGTVLTATGNTNAITTIALTVLVTDTVLIITLAETLGAITPLVTMSISNIVGISAAAMLRVTYSTRHE